MRIGELAERTGVPTKTIRYYEEIGLLPSPDRTPNGYREYDDAYVDLLHFIKDAQATGLTLTEIGSIVEHKQAGDSTCRHVLAMLEQHLLEIEAQIATLHSIRDQLVALCERARTLDPADCTDPIRCQTISTRVEDRRLARDKLLRRRPGPGRSGFSAGRSTRAEEPGRR